ncbi:MAG: hypothetical protein DMF47_08065 [Verrucomicrobia bacterium]|nr:MAG: hypothetical protein DMF47_08065 [Verrucomicrobiota bacterium]PYL99984.1 MAG: hypothetical protein DMF19_11040 [Verrucomicrobiota bacterium]
MNWEMIGALGQIIAAVAVIPSVVYLAIQIRNQNKESRRASANVFILHWSDLRKSMSDNGDLAAIHLRGLQSFDELDSVSKLRFGSGLGRLFLLSEGLYRFYLGGALDPELWGTFERATADLAAYPGVQEWWSTRRHWHTDGFRALVEQMIAEPRNPKAYQRYSEPPFHT